MPNVPYLNQSGESLSDQLGNLLTVKQFGAKGDVLEVGDAQMTAGSAVLYSPSGPFVPAHVGKVGGMPGAGRTTDPIRIVTGGLLGVAVVTNTQSVVATGTFFGSMIAGGYAVFSAYYSDWGGPLGPVNWAIYGSNLSNYSDESSTPLYSGSYDSVWANPNNRDAVTLTWSATASAWMVGSTNVGSYKYWRVKATSATSGLTAGILVNVAQWGPILPFTITAYTDAQHVTVSLNAVSTVSNPIYCYWGTSDDTAFANALAALYQFNSYGLTGGDKLTIPKGAYLLTKPLVIVGNEHLVGDSAALYFDPARFVFPNYTNPGSELVNYLVALSQPGSGGSTFGAILESTDIYQNNIPATAVYVEKAQEQSDLIRVTVHDYNGSQGNPCVFLFGSGVQNFRMSRLWLLGGLANQPQPKTYFTAAVTGGSGSQTVTVNRTDWMGAVGATVSLQAGFYALGTEVVTCTIASATTITGVFLNSHAANDAIMPSVWPIAIDMQYLGGRCDVHDCTLVPGYEAPWGVGIRNLGSPSTIDDIHFEAAMAGILLNGANGDGRLFYGLANVIAVAYIYDTGGFGLSALHAGPGTISPITVYDSQLGVARGGYYTQEYSSDPSTSYVESGVGGLGSRNWFTDPATLVPQLVITPQNGVSMRQLAFGNGSGPSAPYRPMYFGNRASTEFMQWVQRGNSGGLYELQVSHSSGAGMTPWPGIMMRMDTDNSSFGWFQPGLLAFGDGTSTSWTHDPSTPLGPLRFGNTISNCWFQWVQTGTNGRTLELQYSSNSGGSWSNVLTVDATTGIVMIPGLNLNVTEPISITVSGTQVPLMLQNTDSAFYTQITLGEGSAHYWNFGLGNPSETAVGIPNKIFLYSGYSNKVFLVIDESGHLGLGTVNPSAPLHAVAAATGISALFQNTAGSGQVSIEANDGTTWTLISGAAGSHSQAFSIANGGGTQYFIVDSSGKCYTAGDLNVGGNLLVPGVASAGFLSTDSTGKLIASTASPVSAPASGFNDPVYYNGTGGLGNYTPASLISWIFGGSLPANAHLIGFSTASGQFTDAGPAPTASTASGTVPLAKITPTGSDGSMTVVNGVITSITNPS